MAPLSLLELVIAYQQRRISPTELEQGLEQQIQLCRHKQRKLKQLSIPPADQQLWQEDLKPGLEACYEGLCSAAAAARDYASQRNEQLLPGIVALIQEVDRIKAYLSNRAALLSPATGQILQWGMDLHSEKLSLPNPSHTGIEA
ncbi:MAG: hypothetical protein CVV27_05500 [Candidatus Melainabacteria bacterium HGW-Melainabacteria-1]|nr:MAG: hypothetical protein CVV27_05500 [Candidatus Melainabacteria bacterium HGW-Melainabacteria-1]